MIYPITYEEIERMVKETIVEWKDVNGREDCEYRLSILIGKEKTNVALEERTGWSEVFPVQYTEETTVGAMVGFLRCLQMDLEAAKK